jgi:hypothetical protein
VQQKPPQGGPQILSPAVTPDTITRGKSSNIAVEAQILNAPQADRVSVINGKNGAVLGTLDHLEHTATFLQRFSIRSDATGQLPLRIVLEDPSGHTLAQNVVPLTVKDDASQQANGNGQQANSNGQQRGGNTQQPNGNTQQPNGNNTQQANGNTQQPNGNTQQPNGNTQQPNGNSSRIWQGRGIQFEIPPGWEINDDVYQRGGPIALTNFHGAYEKGGIIPVGGSAIDIVLTSPTRDSIDAFVNSELAGAENVATQDISLPSGPARRVAFFDDYGNAFGYENLAVYMPRGTVLVKAYLSYRRGEAQAQIFAESYQHLISTLRVMGGTQ